MSNIREIVQRTNRNSGSETTTDQKSTVNSNVTELAKVNTHVGVRVGTTGMGVRIITDALGEKVTTDALGSKATTDALGEKVSEDALGEREITDALGEKTTTDALGSRTTTEETGPASGAKVSSVTGNDDAGFTMSFSVKIRGGLNAGTNTPHDL